jgi:cell division transport system permease protein
MRLTYVFSELGTGLKRNLSMTVAVIVTIWVSLTLVALGLLLQQQVNKTQDVWGSKLQITVALCNDNTPVPTCVNGATTDAQKAAIQQAMDDSPDVDSYFFRSRAQVYDLYKKISVSDDPTTKALSDVVRQRDFQEQYVITLNDPQKYQGIKSQLSGMQGVATIQDLHQVLGPIYTVIDGLKWAALGAAGVLLISAVLQVSNTIRLAVFARRREIGIMRLVGASSLYIQLPFVMEAVLAGLVGAVLACGSIGLFTSVIILGKLKGHSNITEWVGWHEATMAMIVVLVLGVLLSAVPTLVMSRKYLRV